MEAKGISSSRSRNMNSPSSERFIGLFSRSQPDDVNGDSILSGGADDELDEDEVFWTGDFSQSNNLSDPPKTPSKRNNHNNNQPISFRRPENFGILAALPEDDKKETLGDRHFLYRKASIPSPLSSSSSRMIPSIPKPQSPREREYFLSLPSGKLHQSAPVNVPVLSKAAKMRKPTVFEEDDEDGDDEMLPPHEIVARGYGQSPRTTFSVLEGVGRTLKGRDLRQVRNAVWRQTGFLD
ncbi:Senescence regulator S40 [Macleaya cordata]|uniref:Senescence regulator S40 n=1 Tax=Macleaya cordata TaxID=56857 RepID=A0A200QHX8_MACCD|nr:Senescence regulator S40 [Macleaya cordata]